MIELAQEEISKYYRDGEICEYFFATNRAGISFKPLVAGAAMFNQETQLLDLQFINFKYRKSYIKRIVGSVDNIKFDLAIGARQQSIECLRPTLID